MSIKEQNNKYTCFYCNPCLKFCKDNDCKCILPCESSYRRSPVKLYKNEKSILSHIDKYHTRQKLTIHFVHNWWLQKRAEFHNDFEFNQFLKSVNIHPNLK